MTPILKTKKCSAPAFCKNFFAILFSSFCLNVFAQSIKTYPSSKDVDVYKNVFKNANCGFDILHQSKRIDASFIAQENSFNDAIKNRVKTESVDTVIVPVVVHIISYMPDLISDVTVINAIKDLNDAFSKQGNYFTSTGAATQIRFCLAHIDPDSGVTNGITRNTSFFGSYMNGEIEDHRLKNLIQWPSTEYVNIWYIQSMEVFISSVFLCGGWNISKAGGYANLPPNGGAVDGIVVTAFGTMLAHEMGHYLGLYHTFEGGCKNNDCTIDGDKVCDTPPDQSTLPSPSCNNPDNSCRTDSLSGFLHDTTDYISNFMDYGNTSCSNSFTQGQADRMVNALFTFRSDLLKPKCDYPCKTIAAAYFKKSNNYPVAGDSINFINASANATSFKWYLNDVLVSTNINYGFRFLNQGKYKIALHAFVGTDTCYASYISYVIVNCGVTARFYPSANTIASLLPNFPDTVKFINTSYGATQFEWYYDTGASPVLMSTNRDVNYIFPKPGNYFVYLVATNGGCQDVTSRQKITVLDPTPDGYAVAFNMLCYRDSGLQFQVRVCNNGMATIKKNIPISFYEFNPNLPNANLLATYYTNKEVKGLCCEDFSLQTLWYNHTGYKSLYVVFNDSGHTVTPFQFKNTLLVESNYSNNVMAFSNKYKVTPTPNNVTTAVPFDVVTLQANANEPTSIYKWSLPLNLSCVNCQTTYLTIDSNRIKQIIGVSSLGCRDTDYVKITIPPHNDLKATVQKAECYFKDSIDIDFKIVNKFKKGKILKNTTVAFYTSNPTLPGALLMPPIYNVTQFVNDTIKRCNIRVKNIPTTKIWSVINDTNLGTPIQLPSTWYVETNYVNNIDSFVYENNKKNIIDTTICEGNTFYNYFKTGTYVDTFTSATGCDSFRIIKLKVTPRSVNNIYQTICVGDTFVGYFNSGIYYDTLVAYTGCDSVRILHLFVASKTQSNHNQSICEGSSLWGYSNAGTYVDKLVNSNGCDSIRTLTLSVKPRSYFIITDTICDGDTVMGHSKTGVYFDTLIAVNGCDSVVTLKLLVNPLPKPNLGYDRELCYTESLKLSGGKFAEYLWSNGSVDSAILIDRAGSYWLMATNQYNCVAFDTVMIYPIFCHNPLIPNVFSPNGDRINDTWEIKALKYFINPKVSVFDRWGQLVFASTGYQKPWDGTLLDTRKKLPLGTYYYVIDLQDAGKKIGGSITILY